MQEEQRCTAALGDQTASHTPMLPRCPSTVNQTYNGISRRKTTSFWVMKTEFSLRSLSAAKEKLGSGLPEDEEGLKLSLMTLLQWPSPGPPARLRPQCCWR